VNGSFALATCKVTTANAPFAGRRLCLWRLLRTFETASKNYESQKDTIELDFLQILKQQKARFFQEKRTFYHPI